MSDLKPCPFCGCTRENKLRVYETEIDRQLGTLSVVCGGCAAKVPQNNWNTRHDGWISVDGYKNMPDGLWLVDFEDDSSPEAMRIHTNNTSRFGICGARFAFDMPKVTAYMPLPEKQNK